MKIESMGNRYMYGQQRERQEKPAAAEPAINAPIEKKGVTGPQETAAMPAGSEPKAAGAIRNLHAGHYQGVASLRLQINFQQQLQMSDATRATTMLASSSETLIIGMEQQVKDITMASAASFGETFMEQAGELMDSFRDTVHAFFQGDDPGEPRTILAGIQEAFASFFSAFSVEPEPIAEPLPGVVPAETEPAGELVQDETPGTVQDDAAVGVAGDDGGEPVALVAGDDSVPPPTFAEQLADLQSWFTEQMTILESRVDDLMALPPIGEPRGNGVAYGRFLAMYAEMNSLATTPEPGEDTLSSEGLSTEA